MVRACVSRRWRPLLLGLAGVWCAAAAEVTVYGDRPNAFRFGPVEARFVRLLIVAADSGNEPCLDELEVYGPASGENLARATGAGASASSCLPGYAQHAVAHLNDGVYGNGASWIAAGKSGEWAQIDLGRLRQVDRVVISRDREAQFSDRVPIRFAVQVSRDGAAWQTACEVTARASAGGRPGLFRGVVGEAPTLPPVPPPGQAVARTAPGQARPANEFGLANLALAKGAVAAASSCLPGHAIHRTEHLNDGRTGNAHSWIAGALPAWAEIDLGQTAWVSQVAFGSDQTRGYLDRAASSFHILGATRYAADSAAPTWTVLYRHAARDAVSDRLDVHLRPVAVRWVRIAIDGSAGGDLPRLDEIEVFGSTAPIPPGQVGPLSDGDRVEDPAGEDLRYAFLAEEHAWLKTAGRADLSPRLVPYNGRVQDYPRHVGDDVLPLAALAQAPVPDGQPAEPCWEDASRGVVRVAWPYDFAAGPLVEVAVRAGLWGEHLCLAIEASRILSGHLVVVSAGDGTGCGVVAVTPTGLEFRRFREEERRVLPAGAEALVGALDRRRGTAEVLLPLAWFAGWEQSGLRVGLGMGGRHTAPEGRPVLFLRAPFALSEVSAARPGEFALRWRAEGGAAPEVGLSWAGAPVLPVSWREGTATLSLPAAVGSIGPERAVEITGPGLPVFRLHLFLYDPAARVLCDLDAMLPGLARRGVGVADVIARAAELRARHAAGVPPADRRALFFEARRLQREAFLRDPDLAALEHTLFVKRQPYHPSHNYSDLLDAPWRPGGAVCRLDIPREQGRLAPEKGVVTVLFDAGKGIARDPVATPDARRIAFSYRATQDSYFRLTTMDVGGAGIRTLGDGPFHDLYPCPLPDGDLAFISTRCRARFLCWRPQAYVLFRMRPDGSEIRPLSYANLSEWAPSVTRDGRILWTRSEYVDKGADFSHTLWTIRPDGTHPELAFGNTIIQPNGYANGREVPGTAEICCTLISHFGDLNGPIALVDTRKGRFTRDAITALTPEVPWPGMWPDSECFRDPVPISRDLVLCAHAPREQFALYVIDRYGHRELLHLDRAIGSMSPTPLRALAPSPRLPVAEASTDETWGVMAMADVYAGISPPVERGRVAYLRLACEVRSDLVQLPDGSYRRDHEPFMHWYAGPTDKVSGPYGWPSYVAKASLGLVPVDPDGSAHFRVPAGKVVYFQALDADLNELQRMRSVVQMQPGEQRSCIGCHEDRRLAPAVARKTALRREPDTPRPPPWGAVPFAYESVVQPVLDRHCVRCHTAGHPRNLDLSGRLDADRVPASYRTFIRAGLVHYLDYQYNAGGNEKKPPLSFGVCKSEVVKVLAAGHHGVSLSADEWHALKCWIDLNCPLWPDYKLREERRGAELATGP